MKELLEILKVLYDAHLEFVVIGGAAMHLQGSAYVTKDVDFCYARTPQNIKRLVVALAPIPLCVVCQRRQGLRKICTCFRNWKLLSN